MSVAPHAGVVDFGTFTPPTLSLDGIQGEVPQPLIGQENYVLTGNGWSSLAALGALTYQGTWNASTNTPTLVSSVGVQGYYYVVSVAGSTNLNGITTWDVGDWAIFNGSTWQKIEGGSAGTFQTLTVTGQAALNTVTGNTSIADTSTVGQFGVKLGTLFSSGSAWDSKVALFGNINTASGAGSGAFGVAFDTTQGTSLMSIAPLIAWYNMRYLGNSHQFFGIGFEQLRVAPTNSAVNYVQVTGGATTAAPVISSQGSDGNIALSFVSKGTARHNFFNNGATSSRQFAVGTSGITSAVNFLNVDGSVAGIALPMQAQGTDTNISMAFQPKGTGAIDLAAGSSGINISNGGTVTAVTRIAGGNSYTTALTATISAPTTAGGTTATATAYAGAITVGIANGGTGYTLNDVITVIGGTRTQAQACTVTGVSSGVITAVSVQTFGYYTVLPTNPVSVTGGTGSGATLNLSNWSFTNITLDTAGSGYIEQPTVTISGSGGSGATAFATIGSNTSIRTHGNYASFFASNSGSESLRLYGNDSGGSQYQQNTGPGLVIIPAQSGYAASRIGTQQNFHQLEIGSGINTAGAIATAFNTGVTYGPSSGGIGSGSRQFVVAHTASAANYVQVTGATTTNGPFITAQGSDTNIPLNISGKGGSGIAFYQNGSGTPRMVQMQTQAGAVNYHTFTPSLTTNAPIYAVDGTDTNIAIGIRPKGTGAIDLAAGSSGVNISNGGTVTALTRTNSGTSYTSAPTWTASAPTTAGGVTATGTTTLSMQATPTITSGGTGYTVGDVLTLVGGTFLSGTAAVQLTVTTVSAGVITGVTVSYAGNLYTAVPTNPISVTGGSGTGATFTSTTQWGVQGSLIIGNAGSGYIEQPTITFSGGGGSGAAATARVGSGTIFKSLGGTASFNTYAGEGLRINNDGFGTLTDYVEIQGGASVSGAYIGVNGSTAIASLYVSGKGGGTVDFFTNGQGNARQARISHTASAVNYVQLTGASTTNAPALSVQGTDTNIGFVISTKGNGSITLRNNNSGNIQFRADGLVTAVNYLQVAGSLTTNAPILSSQGSDTNISMVLQSKGTGSINLATGSTGINISNGGTVTAITRTVQGSNYTSVPSLAISAPTTAFGVQATATANLGVLSATIVSGGTGYTAGDTLTVVGGTGTAAQLTVSTVSSGVITAVTVATQNGVYSVFPTNNVSVTGGTGSGATFTISGGILSTFTITAAGSGYIEQPTITFSGGGGSGAAAYATVGSGTTIKSIGTTSGSSLTFQTPSSITSNLPAMRILDGTGGYDTFVTIQPASAYTVISAAGNAGANLFLSATGAGSVRLMTGGTSLVEQMRVTNTASAVNRVEVTGAITGSLPTISAQGSDASIGLSYNTKGFTGSHRFFLGGAEALRLEQFGSTAVVNRFSMFANVSGGAPMLTTRGSDTDVGFDFSTQGASNYRFYTNTASNGTGFVQFAVNHTASAVNFTQLTGAITSNYPILTATGTDANVGFLIRTKGAPAGPGFRIENNNGSNVCAAVQMSVTSPVNYPYLQPAATGSAPSFSANGSDTNIDLALTPKGTGRVKYGTHTANADAPITGYIEILDSSGTIRKLAVIA